MPDMTGDPRYKQGLVPARTDVWTDEWVPANGLIIRAAIERGDGAKLDMDELTGIVTAYLASHGVDPKHLEGFLLNLSSDKSVPSSAGGGPRDFSAEVGSHFAGRTA